MNAEKIENEDESETGGGSLYAWLTRGEDGTEGIMVAPLPNGLLFSLVFDDQAAAQKHVPFIRKEMELRGGTAQLVEFARGETVAEVRAKM